jgi:hypothetical protein
VEQFVDGELINMPCLYDRGRLVAAIASRKVALEFPCGPSAINEFLVIDDRLRDLAERMGGAFGLHGFASADVFLARDEDDDVVLEINPRTVAQIHLGRLLGVDMAEAFADVLSGRWDGTPRLAAEARTVRLFPQDARRYQRRWGRVRGLLRWAAHADSWGDVPFGDLGLLGKELHLLATVPGAE